MDGAVRAEENRVYPAVEGWPDAVEEIRYISSADNTEQPALLYNPGTAKAVPLLVALHTWNGDYLQKEPQYAYWCIKNGWGMIHPHFRGGNNNPEACCSELVVQDIVSAVHYAEKLFNVDESRIYLVGVSGGGHASLLMAGRHPEIWAAVSAWCPIYDLKAWHEETARRGHCYYSRMIEQCCGGVSGDSVAVDNEYSRRSPSSWLKNAVGLSLDINTGIADGHAGSVSVSQALNAYNALAEDGFGISEGTIAAISAAPEMPGDLKQQIDDPLYASSPVLFRKTTGSSRVTVFQGGHQINYNAALNWLSWQRKGQTVVWAGDDVCMEPLLETTDAHK